MPQVKVNLVDLPEPRRSQLLQNFRWMIPLSLGVWVVVLWSISVALQLLWGVLVT